MGKITKNSNISGVSYPHSFCKLDKIFKPSGIAIIGASRKPGKAGHDVVKGLIDCGYEGDIHPINPKVDEILGLKVYPRITAIPGDVDIAVIVVPAPIVPRVMEDCIEKKVLAAIIWSSGFSEVGGKGKLLQEKIINMVEGTGVRIIGPNCIGIYCSSSKVSFSSDAAAQLKGSKVSDSVALISQSGSICTRVRQMLIEKGIKLGKFVSSGNEVDLTATDFLEYLGTSDPETRIILAYLESIRDGRKFYELAKKICKRKPIIVWKAGITKAGSRAALSHTGAIAGQDAIYDAVFKQSGIIRAANLGELVDYAVAFLRIPYLQGRNVGIVAGPGGPAVSATDACEMIGLNVPEFSQKTKTSLTRKLPPFAGVRNPADLTLQALQNPRLYKVAIDTIMKDKNIDVLMVVSLGLAKPIEFAKIIIEGKIQYKKPLVVCVPTWTSSREVIRSRKILEKAGFAVYPTPERAASALTALVRYKSCLQKGISKFE